MRTMILALATAATLGLAAPAATAAQGPPEHAQEKKPKKAAEKGQERGNARARGQSPQARGQSPQKARAGEQGQARGQSGSAAAERRGPPGRVRAKRGGPAPEPRVFNRNLVEKAARARGKRAGQARGVDVRREQGKVRVLRQDGRMLFELDENTADELGYWRAAVAPPARERSDRRTRGSGGIFGTGDRYPADRDEGKRRGAPSFCRSGEGHPVWGADWCLDKGFGLGDGDRSWGVDRTIEDIILRRDRDRNRDVVQQGGLIDILGDVVFGRLALQSLVLGADEPLTGRWLAPRQDGPGVLRIQAGDLPVAELVDYENDGQVDRILFNLGR